MGRRAHAVVLRRNRHQHAVEREEEEFFAVVLAPSVYDRMYTARLPEETLCGVVMGSKRAAPPLARGVSVRKIL
jgi:hypothetical protein